MEGKISDAFKSIDIEEANWVMRAISQESEKPERRFKK